MESVFKQVENITNTVRELTHNEDFGLLNKSGGREWYKDRQLAIESDTLDRNHIGYLFLDIDDMKGLNNRLNYDGANKVIKKAFASFQDKTGDKARIFQWFAGDEFVVVTGKNTPGKYIRESSSLLSLCFEQNKLSYTGAYTVMESQLASRTSLQAIIKALADEVQAQKDAGVRGVATALQRCNPQYDVNTEWIGSLKNPSFEISDIPSACKMKINSNFFSEMKHINSASSGFEGLKVVKENILLMRSIFDTVTFKGVLCCFQSVGTGRVGRLVGAPVIQKGSFVFTAELNGMTLEEIDSLCQMLFAEDCQDLEESSLRQFFQSINYRKEFDEFCRLNNHFHIKSVGYLSFGKMTENAVPDQFHIPGVRTDIFVSILRRYNNAERDGYPKQLLKTNDLPLGEDLSLKEDMKWFKQFFKKMNRKKCCDLLNTYLTVNFKEKSWYVLLQNHLLENPICLGDSKVAKSLIVRLTSWENSKLNGVNKNTVQPSDSAIWHRAIFAFKNIYPLQRRYSMAAVLAVSWQTLIRSCRNNFYPFVSKSPAIKDKILSRFYKHELLNPICNVICNELKCDLQFLRKKTMYEKQQITGMWLSVGLLYHSLIIDENKKGKFPDSIHVEACMECLKRDFQIDSLMQNDDDVKAKWWKQLQDHMSELFLEKGKSKISKLIKAEKVRKSRQRGIIPVVEQARAVHEEGIQHNWQHAVGVVVAAVVCFAIATLFYN
eukprot:g7316.t1